MKSKEPHLNLVQCFKARVYGTCDMPTNEKKWNIGDRCVLCKPEVPNPVRNWAARQEVSGGRASEASPAFTAEPHHVHDCLRSASCQISVALDSHRSENPTVSCTCQRSGLCIPYENHPETILLLLPHPYYHHQSMEKFHETSPWCHNIWESLV